MKRNTGFTLIELVIVIIVLGILAATAVPKFINLQDDARASAMTGVEAAIHSAANIVYARAAIDGVETTENEAVSAAGATVNVDFGYPSAEAAGIEEALELSGFDGEVDNTATAGFMFAATDNTDVDGSFCLLYTEATSVATYTVVKGQVNGAEICDTTTAGNSDW